MSVFYEFEVELLSKFFSEAENDQLCLIKNKRPFLDEKIGLMWFEEAELIRYLKANGRARSSIVDRVMAELTARGAAAATLRLYPFGFPGVKVRLRVMAISATLIPPEDDWGAIREIDLLTEETEGIRTHFYVSDPAAKKMARLKEKYGQDIDPKRVKGNDRRFIPTSEDYEAISTTVVMIMSRELTSEPPPPPERTACPEKWEVSARVINFNAYAEALLDRESVENGESVIYPINAGVTLASQQVALRAAVGRVNPAARLKIERYGDRYLRLKLER